MKNYVIYVLCLLACVQQACEEPPPPPVVIEDPFFQVIALVDGDSLELAGGEDDYYLFTRFDQNEEGLYTFEGDLKPLDCQDCGPQLSIVFRDVRLRTMGEIPDANSIIQTKDYDFTGSQQDTIAYETRFTGLIDNRQDYMFDWDLGDGTRSQAASFTHRYLRFPEQYEIKLSISDANCTSELSQLIDVPKRSCFPAFSVEKLPAGNFSALDFEVLPQPGFSYTWDFGDGNQATGEQVTNRFDGRGAYQVCVEAIGASCQAINCRNITVGEVGGCAVNFAYESTPVLRPDSLDLGSVTVAWTDKNGRIFRSANLIQPTESFFQLLQIETYEKNENDFATLAYDFSMACKLRSGGDEILLEIPVGKMAIAYPD